MVKNVVHISETEAASDFASLMARVRAGAEIECIALLPEDSTATIDPDFAKDVEAAVESHREPLNPPAFD